MRWVFQSFIGPEASAAIKAMFYFGLSGEQSKYYEDESISSTCTSLTNSPAMAMSFHLTTDVGYAFCGLPCKWE